MAPPSRLWAAGCVDGNRVLTTARQPSTDHRTATDWTSFPGQSWHAQSCGRHARRRQEGLRACNARHLPARGSLSRRTTPRTSCRCCRLTDPPKPHGRLITSAQPWEGFTALWERRRLDLTVEAHVIQYRFHPLFTDAERQALSTDWLSTGTHRVPEAARPTGWAVASGPGRRRRGALICRDAR